MPFILKKCFLYHYDSSINSDKVFNLFLINNENGTYSAISEYGRNETKLNVKSLVENCSLSLAESRFYEKRSEKVFHPKTPYSEAFSCSYSPTLKQYDSAQTAKTPSQIAKVIDFKAAAANKPLPIEKESGEQTKQETVEPRKRQTGALNLSQLDALEL